jgi:hypothetical protein
MVAFTFLIGCFRYSFHRICFLLQVIRVRYRAYRVNAANLADGAFVFAPAAKMAFCRLIGAHGLLSVEFGPPEISPIIYKLKKRTIGFVCNPDRFFQLNRSVNSQSLSELWEKEAEIDTKFNVAIL